MEFSRPRPSILSLFDPLSLTPELDRATSSDSDKENDASDFYLSGTQNHIHAPPRTLKRRLVDVGDTTVEHPDSHALLSDELEQELSYIVNDDDDENETLTFRDMAKAATPKWSSRDTTAFETPKVSLPRTPLAEISLKDELTPLARKKLYKRQPVSTTPKGSRPTCPVFPPFVPSDSYSGHPPSHAEVPEVRINDKLVPQNSPIPVNSPGDLSSRTSNSSTSTETLVGVPSIPADILPSSLVVPVPSRAQMGTRHLSPASPTNNANRYSIDLQTSFQIHFPSCDTTFDLLKDKISFFDSRNEFDSFFNNLEGDSSLDDDISIPGPESKIETESGVSSMDQAQRLIDHPEPVSEDAGFEGSFKASPTNVDALTLVQPSTSNQIDTMLPLVADASAKATLVQPDAFQTPTSPPVPLVTNSSRPPSSSGDNFRHPPPQIPALRIVKRSKTIIQQKPSTTTKDSPPQRALISVGSRVPVTEAPAPSSLLTITEKGHPSPVSQVQRIDKAHLPPSLVSNGPRRVLISEGPKLKPAPNARANASLEQVKHSGYSGPRRVAMAVPPTFIERASSSTRPRVPPSSELGQPVKYETSIVKPVQRMAGSRLPAITKRIGSRT